MVVRKNMRIEILLLSSLLLSALYAGLDALNFKVLAREFYTSFYQDGITNYWAAAAVYILYPLAVVYFTRSTTALETLTKAAILGLTGYGLYHLTNMATLRDWRLDIAAYDTAWGVGVTMILSYVARVLGAALRRSAE
jgi:uncharacterized membrane protein